MLFLCRLIPCCYLWCEADCRAIAQQFDNRNGNAHYSRRLERPEEVLSLAGPFPL